MLVCLRKERKLAETSGNERNDADDLPQQSTHGCKCIEWGSNLMSMTFELKLGTTIKIIIICTTTLFAASIVISISITITIFSLIIWSLSFLDRQTFRQCHGQRYLKRVVPLFSAFFLADCTQTDNGQKVEKSCSCSNRTLETKQIVFWSLQCRPHWHNNKARRVKSNQIIHNSTELTTTSKRASKRRRQTFLFFRASF